MVSVAAVLFVVFLEGGFDFVLLVRDVVSCTTLILSRRRKEIR